MTLSCAQRLKQAGLSLRDGEELLLLHMERSRLDEVPLQPTHKRMDGLNVPVLML